MQSQSTLTFSNNAGVRKTICVVPKDVLFTRSSCIYIRMSVTEGNAATARKELAALYGFQEIERKLNE